MPSAVNGVPYVNRRPLFVCSSADAEINTAAYSPSTPGAGSSKDQSATCWTCQTKYPSRNQMWNHLNADTSHQKDPPGGFKSPLWPALKQLRVKFMPGEDAHLGGIEDIVKAAIDEWNLAMSDTLSFEWVDRNAQADIRISLQKTGSSWSALASRATLCPADKPTMNLSMGGWKEKMTIWPFTTIQKAAAHLFGHALGLPCSKLKWPGALNQSVLADKYGSNWADVILQTGNASTSAYAQSVMGFGSSTEGSFGYNGTEEKPVVLGEPLQLMKQLYPKTLAAYYQLVKCRSTSGWSPGVGSKARQWLSTTSTSNIVAGLTRICIHTDANYRVTADVENVTTGQGMSIGLGSWADTTLTDAECNVLAFDPQDMRIQTGREHSRDWKPDRESYDAPGTTLSKRITFARPFRNPPKVIAFISGLDYIHGANVRCEVQSTSIDQNGFTLSVVSWANSISFNTGVSWLAHEADEPTIRSGHIPAPQFFPGHSYEHNVNNIPFSPPVPRRPNILFYAYTMLDVSTDSSILVNLEAACDESGVTASFRALAFGSPFYCLQACYVAVL